MLVMVALEGLPSPPFVKTAKIQDKSPWSQMAPNEFMAAGLDFAVLVFLSGRLRLLGVRIYLSQFYL